MQKKCNDNNHIALFYLTDLKKANMAQYVCLECDVLVNINKDINTMNNIVYRQDTNIDPFSEYMKIRPKYINLINQGLTPLEAVDELNNMSVDSKVLKKTTNN